MTVVRVEENKLNLISTCSFGEFSTSLNWQHPINDLDRTTDTSTSFTIKNTHPHPHTHDAEAPPFTQSERKGTAGWFLRQTVPGHGAIQSWSLLLLGH